MDEQGWAAPDTSPTADAGFGGGSTMGEPIADEPSGPSRIPPKLPVPLRPMTLTDLLDGAFAVIKARPRTVFGIAAAVLIPAHVVAAFLQRHASETYSVTNTLNMLNVGGRTNIDGGDIVGVYAASALLLLSLYFLGGALSRLVTAWYAGSDLTAGEALAASFKRTPTMIGAFLLLAVPKAVGFCFCYLPGILLVTLWCVVAPVIVVERVGAVAAARRSWRLVSTRLWPCVGIIVLATLGAQLMTSVMGTIPTLLASILPSPFDWIAVAAVSSGVAMIVTTALVSVSVLLYLDLRIRSEGLDLELSAADAFAEAR